MKVHHSRLMHYAASGICVLSLALALPIASVSLHAPARAEAIVPPAEPTTPINMSKMGSITIHKYLNQVPSTIPGDGSQITDTGSLGTPLQNVSFKVEKVKLTHALNTQEGQQEAAALTADTAQIDGSSIMAAKTVKTTSDGSIKVDSLNVGVYKVTELPSPDATPLKPGQSLVPVAAFLVQLPMTDTKTRNSWLYDVHVYPKNQSNGATKTVDDKDQQAGNKIMFTVSADVPAVATGKQMKKFVISDDIDKKRLDVRKNDVSVQLKDGSSQPETVDETKYDIQLDSSTLKLTVTFKDSDGLTYLTQKAQGKSGVKVLVNIPATVKVLGTSRDGTIKNTATVVSNNGSSSTDVTTNTNTTKTIYGKLTIHKTDATGSTPLKDAKFKLWHCDSSGNKTGNSNITVNSIDEWTTDTSGDVTINGLHVTDRANDKTVSDGSQYCLEETQAPQGYELAGKLIPVTFASTDLGTTGTNIGMKTVTVKDTKSWIPHLPMTGGPGIILLVIAGLAIIIGGTVYGVRARKHAAMN